MALDFSSAPARGCSRSAPRRPDGGSIRSTSRANRSPRSSTTPGPARTWAALGTGHFGVHIWRNDAGQVVRGRRTHLPAASGRCHRREPDDPGTESVDHDARLGPRTRCPPGRVVVRHDPGRTVPVRRRWRLVGTAAIAVGPRGPAGLVRRRVRLARHPQCQPRPTRPRHACGRRVVRWCVGQYRRRRNVDDLHRDARRLPPSRRVAGSEHPGSTSPRTVRRGA